MNRVVAEMFTGFSAWILSANQGAIFTGLAGINNANLAMLTFEGSAVRYRLDGVTAHSGTGHLVSGNDVLMLHGSDAIKGFNVCVTVPTAWLMASFGSI